MAVFLGLMMLVGCNSDVSQGKNDLSSGADDNQEKITSESDNGQSEDQFDIKVIDKNSSDFNDIENFSELTVDANRCIGCGKCVKLAAENFVLSGGSAEVISQENLDGDKVIKAINNCPVGAITI